MFGIFMDILLVFTLAILVTIAIQFYRAYQGPPPPPPAQGTNTVTGVFLQEDNGPEIIAGYVYPNYEMNTNFHYGPLPLVINNGFTVQYGVDLNTNPWIATADETVPQDLVGSVQIGQNNSTNFQFTLTLNGIGLATYYNSSTDMDGEIDINNTNVFQSVTDNEGTVVTYTPILSVSTNCVIIQRTTNFMTWDNVFTDYVSPGGVSYWTDTNIFYAPTPPTGTNGIGGPPPPPDGLNPPGGTNGIPVISAGAFYRLAFPTNQ